MGLSLLVPAFLLGLLALAIPIWVHLRDRPHSQSIEFPSLMFLERVPHRAERRQVLRNRALLAVRAAALTLLALAFARPLLGGADMPALLPAGSRDVVLVLDRSASMGAGDRWARAQAAASEALDRLGGGDRVALVLFDEEPSVALPLGPDIEAARNALRALRPGDGGTRLAAGVRAAGEVIGNPVGDTEVVLISDFQRRGWDPLAELSLPPGVRMSTVAVADTAEADNRAVAEVRPLRDPAEPGRMTVSARITRTAGELPAETTATLVIEGGPSESRRVQLPPDGAVTVEFAPLEGLPDPVRGTVTIGADRLPADDALYFVTSPGQVIRVLLLQHDDADAGSAFFLERALAVGMRPAFAVERRRLAGLSAADLESVDLVILDDAGELTAGAVASLRTWLAAGGGLLLAAGELTERLEPDSETPLLAFTFAEPEDRSIDLGGSIAFVDVAHPALEIFGGAAGAELGGARFWTYRPLQPPPASGVLVRFDDGNAALVEQQLGEGRVLAWTGTFDSYWSDLPTQPAFVPFVHELAKHASGYREPQPWLPAGRSLAAGQLIDAPADRLAQGELRLDDEPVTPPLRLTPGFHRVAIGEAPGVVVAANVDRGEGDATVVDPEEVAAAVVERQYDDTGEATGGVSPIQLRERRQSLWWYVMLLGFALLVAETVLSNRLSVRAS